MRHHSLLSVLILLLACPFATSAALITSTGTKPSVGNGNSGSPYEIRTAEELRWFVHYENTRHWYPNDHAKLMANIDLSTICGPDKGSWIPLGFAEEDGAKGYYYGDFDGNGYTISGMYQNGDDLYNDIYFPQGFFGTLGGAHIKDLTIEGTLFNIGTVAGGLAGSVGNESMRYNKIVNCESKVDFYLYGILQPGDEEPEYNPNSYDCIGGIVGEWSEVNSEDMENCVFSGKFHFSRTTSKYAGALIGSASGRYFGISFYNCVAVTGQGFPMIGYAKTYKCKFNNCVTDGAIVGNLAFVDTESGPRFTGNVYCSDKGLYERRVGQGVGEVNTDSGNVFVSPDAIANGNVCYTLNQKLEGKYFTQTLGTDKVPYPNSAHATVYRVKKYTACGTDKWEWTFSNTDEDDTTLREHLFEADHAYCTRCGGAVNPDYGVSRDAEGYYLAATAEDIKWLWNLVNVTGVTDAKIRLTADIDMDNEAMEPLAKFSGIFDGQGHTIANINISCSGKDKVGLVGELSGSIRNLILSGSVSGSYMKYLGAFAGYAGPGSSISNVRNDCTVKATGTMNGAITMYVGGITGFTDGSLAYAINNGPVVDASVCTGTLTLFMAGLAGMVSVDNPHHLANNAVVGAQSNTASAVTASAVANMSQGNECSQSYYTAGISNPGLQCFFSNDHNSSDTSVTPVEVGSGRLAWLLSGKDYDADDSTTVFFGQTIGTDLVPYPFVSESHKGAYNARHYYTCDSYSDYSNSPTDEEPLQHNWNANHYCDVCYVINPSYMEQDAATKAYKISNTEQYNVFVSAVNAADGANKPMRYASASLQDDLDFSSSTAGCLYQLNGRIHGNGHSITFGSESSNFTIATYIGEEGIIEYLDVAYPSTNFYAMVGTNFGRIIGCNITRGVPTGESAGLVIDCSGELQNSKDLYGRFTSCLIKTFTIEGATNYRLYNSNAGCKEYATYTEIPLEKGESGELAYQMSHGEGSSQWGQNLGTDASPRIYFGQTPASDTYVTSLTSYSVEYPEGKVEYMNAGMALEAAPGCYKVCKDTESWTTHPAYNFIIDNGDGTYSAEHINLDPTAQHWLPLEVHADRLTFQSVDENGEMVSKKYLTGDIVSLIFPVDMPADNINGTVYLFDGYDALNNILLFTSALDDGFKVPANTPFLVKAFAGSILTGDLTDVSVRPMTEASYGEQQKIRHLAGYRQQVLPSSRTMEDGEYVVYYVQSGDKAFSTTDGASTASQFDSYFRLPWDSMTTAQEELDVVLVDSRELGTSRIIERDLFSIPYGRIGDGAEWEKVSHLNNATHPDIFYGNDITMDCYANISAYELLYIHGTPGQKHYFYFNGSEPTEVTIDEDGDGFIDLNKHRVGIGDVYLHGIRVAEGESLAVDAYAKVYKYLEEGLMLYGYGDFSDDLKGYPFYDATGVKCGITLNLDNPNAVVVGAPNVKGVYNRIEKSADVMQGFVGESLRLTDGGDFCYDYSVKCPDVTFTRYDVPEGTRYVSFVLPFAVKYIKGMHEYVDCDGQNVYFNTPEDGIIDAYLPIVIDMQEYEGGNTITITGEDFLALSPNGVFNVTPAPSSQYDMCFGFVKKRQENVPLDNAEVADYNVYGFSTSSYRFVKAKNTFSISPFRAFFMLPKASAARARGFAAPEYEAEALDIVLDGEEIDVTGIGGLTMDGHDDGVGYNLLGIPVGPNYRGLVIRNGKKIIIR